MINAILTGIFNLVIGLVSIILSPIDLAISTALPDVAKWFDNINIFLNYVIGYIQWAISWTGLNSEVRSIIVLYFTFILTVPLIVSTVKLSIKWYDKLKV